MSDLRRGEGKDDLRRRQRLRERHSPLTSRRRDYHHIPPMHLGASVRGLRLRLAVERTAFPNSNPPP